MLKLKTMYGLMDLNDYLEVFNDQGVRDLERFYEANQSNQGFSQVLTEVSLCWNEAPLDYQLQLVAPSSLEKRSFFTIEYSSEGQPLETTQLVPARKSNLMWIKKMWMEQVQLFVYAAASSYLTDQTVTPNEAQELFGKVVKLELNQGEEKDQTLKDELKIQTVGGTFSVKVFSSESKPLHHLKFNHLMYEWYDSFLYSYRQGQWIKLADSDEGFIVDVPESEMRIVVGHDELKLPIAFSLALYGEKATEVNDGECSANWLLGIEFRDEMIYLPIGCSMELGYFEEENFVSAVSEAIETIDACMEFIELLALETKSGLTLSSNLIQKEYESIISKPRQTWRIESGKMSRNYNNKFLSQPAQPQQGQVYTVTMPTAPSLPQSRQFGFPVGM